MQKQFITPIKFWLAGVIAITVLFTVSGCQTVSSQVNAVENGKSASQVNAGKINDHKINDQINFKVTKILETVDGKKLCVEVDPITRCEKGVKCDFQLTAPEHKSLAEILNFKLDVRITIPGMICPIFDIDTGLPNTMWRCSGYWYCSPYR